MNLDSFVCAKRIANRRAKVLDVFSSKWLSRLASVTILGPLFFEPIVESLWDWAFDRYVRADAEANLWMEAEIKRSGGTVFRLPSAHRDREYS